MKQTACKDHLCEETKVHPLALAAHNQFHDLTYVWLIVPSSYFITDVHMYFYSINRKSY